MASFGRDFGAFDAGFDIAGHDAYTVSIARNRAGKYHVSIDLEVGEIQIASYAVGGTLEIAFDRATDELAAELAKADAPIDLVPSETTLPSGVAPVSALAVHADATWWSRLWAWLRGAP